VLEAALEHPGLRQADIARVTGYSAVEVHRIVKTLVQAGWLVCTDGRYHEGPQFRRIVTGG
jgi:DNA-binding IclR family transcriptional regulator